MKILLTILTITLALPVMASQRVWLNQSQTFYDPADPHQRQVYFMTFPLEEAKTGDRYEVKLYHANGQLYLEGAVLEPQWMGRKLIGDFQTYYPDGSPGESGHYKKRPDNCGCDHQYTVQDGRFVDYYQNGQLHYERTYVDDELQDGDYQEFDAQGRVTREYTYVDGGYDGAVKEYKKGELTKQAHYQEGQRDGWLIRYKAGKPTFRKRYRNDKADGAEISYVDGEKRKEYHYVEGAKRGVQKRYHPNGVLREIWTVGKNSRSVGKHVYYNEQGIRTRVVNREYNEQGAKIAQTDKQYDDEGRLTNRRVHRGHYRLNEEFDSNGELVERFARDSDGRQGLYLSENYGSHVRAHYLDSEYHGAYRKTNDNGAFSEGNYKHGQKEGLWVAVSADGERTETHYRNDVKHGSFAVYDANGKTVQHARYVDGKIDGDVDMVNSYGRHIVASFQKGQRHGDYRAYTEDGRLLKKGHYTNGEPDGLIYVFDATGRMKTKKSYSDGTPDGEWLQTNFDGEIVSRKVYREGEPVLEMTLEDRANEASGVY